MTQTRGSYSQTIIISDGGSTIKISRDNEVIFDGAASAITNIGNILKFKDGNGDDRTFVKYELDTSI